MHAYVGTLINEGESCHSSAPLILICPLLLGLLVESLCDLELSMGIGLSTVILICFASTHTQTQILAGVCCVTLYMTTIGPQLGAHASTGNMILCVCCTYIISIPKHDWHAWIHIHTYIQAQNQIWRGISCLWGDVIEFFIQDSNDCLLNNYYDILCIYSIQVRPAHKGMWGWWAAAVAVRSKVEWNFATITIGEQSVMIGGTHLMPEWSVGSSVIPVQV